MKMIRSWPSWGMVWGLLLASLPHSTKAGPDIQLQIFRLIHPPSTNLPGSSVLLSFYMMNIGDQTTGNMNIDYYASTDATITASDWQLGSWNLFSLEPGRLFSSQDHCTFPMDMPAGTYYVGAVVTCLNDVNLANNVASYDSMVRIITPPPDLAVEGVDSTATFLRPGDSISIHTSVENRGYQSAAYVMDHYLSADFDITAADYRIGSMNGYLGIREQQSQDTRYEIPPGIPAGFYYIAVVATCEGDTNPSNNPRLGWKPIWIGPFADLAIQTVETDIGTYSPTDSIIVHTVIQNVGDYSSNGYTIDLYASKDTTFAAPDIHIGSFSSNPLPPGDSYRFDAACRLPAYVPQGDVYIGIVVTCPHEGNPENNQGYDPRAVTISHPAGYVCGQAKYRDGYSHEHPLRYARIKVYDSNQAGRLMPDRELGQTHTDGDGNYGVRIPTDAGSGQGLYVVVLAQGVKER